MNFVTASCAADFPGQAVNPIFFIAKEGIEFIHLYRINILRHWSFWQLNRMRLYPVHDRHMAYLQLASYLPKAKPIYVHPDCSPGYFLIIPRLLSLRSVSCTTILASVTLAPNFCVNISVLMIFLFTFWKFHTMILPDPPGF